MLRAARVALLVAASASAACATSDPIAPTGLGEGAAGSSGSTSKASSSSSSKASSSSSASSTTASSGSGSLTCGDGTVDPGEECDDGNLTTFDGCTTCVVDCEMSAHKYAANHHCYRVFSTVGDEPTAEAACEAWGGAAGLGHLVSVSDAGEQAFLVSFVTQPGWMGGGDVVTEGTYKWYDGSAFAFTHWAPNEPNDPGHVENCIFAQATGDWDDHNCAMTQPTYICERIAAGSPP